MKKNNKYIGLFFWAIMIVMSLTSSVNKASKIGQTEYLIYASLMNHIAVNTQWPASRRTGDFVIGIVGTSPIEVELKKMAASKKIGGRNIVVKRFKSASDLDGCHMVFVPKSKHSILTSIADKGKVMNALVITEQCTKKDFVFNFVKKDGKPRFEYNKNRAASHGVVVSPNLVKLSIQVN